MRSTDIWSKPSNGKILVVEPEPDIARMLEVRLARDGHKVLVADCGKTAIEATQGETLDVAIIDGKIPDVSAFELMDSLRGRHRPFEVILTSIDPSTEMLVRALEHGAFDVVVKPFVNMKVLTSKLKHAIDKVRAERDRDALGRMLAAQTNDLVHREAEVERSGTPLPALITGDFASENTAGLDLDGISGTDPLTGLPNRRSAEERFTKEAARALRYDRPLCIALASVDGLDRVVDRCGAAVADGVLRGIASIFSGMVRNVDFCARQHGGEFLFIFPETPKESGAIVIERIREALAKTTFSEPGATSSAGTPLHLTASFGISAVPTDTMNAVILKEAAEAALREAKKSGDKVVLFDLSMLHES